MPLIKLALGLAILGFLYVRMIRREEPEPIGKAQAVVPVVLGVVAVVLSFAMFIAFALVLKVAGYSGESVPLFLRSLISAFFLAGLPEELAKLAMMLLTLLIFRDKVKNVYELILIGAAVGFGFSLFEEFLYGSANGFASITRIVMIAAHMSLGIVMAKHLGFAKHKKAAGSQSVVGEYALAVAIPMAIHTFYDAFTVSNKMLDSPNDTIVIIGVVSALVVVAAMFAWQVYEILSFKRNTQKYCDMELALRS